MTAHPRIPLEDLKALLGEEVGVSDWIDVSQVRIDAFADATGDHQFIHVDPIAAAKTPFGGTIAHGFLTLSLLAPMGQQALPHIEGRAMGVNYGFEKLRFVTPVKSGARVRGHFTLADVTQRSDNQVLTRWQVTVEIEGEARPALIAEWLNMTVLA